MNEGLFLRWLHRAISINQNDVSAAQRAKRGRMHKIRAMRTEKQKVIFSIEQRKTAKKETCPRKEQINYSSLDILCVNFFKKSH
ncbi:hypothetical protein EXE25_02795 [Acinetobacter bouvetii]|uniref:Uncharacterized protein n=1 Tax=Acinetobacter bouvetii TaxID=202951 RepID=A0A4Q7B2N8_9GAMM|nr:hypothetical protein [Acinetobacter bouvetii]RZG69373.1 hypothetical protein EXE25_02795 [Acinetobacter bouvetii]